MLQITVEIWVYISQVKYMKPVIFMYEIVIYENLMNGQGSFFFPMGVQERLNNSKEAQTPNGSS